MNGTRDISVAGALEGNTLAIPEPATLSLLVVLGAAALVRCRGRA